LPADVTNVDGCQNRHVGVFTKSAGNTIARGRIAVQWKRRAEAKSILKAARNSTFTFFAGSTCVPRAREACKVADELAPQYRAVSTSGAVRCMLQRQRPALQFVRPGVYAWQSK
jgi:hypothetical protein